MEEKGYQRYSAIMGEIRERCNNLEPVELVMGPIVGTEEKKCEHYILENGLHVYVMPEDIYVSDRNISFFEDGKRDRKTSELCVIGNEYEVSCVHYAEDGLAETLVKYISNENTRSTVVSQEGLGDKQQRDGRVPMDIETAMIMYRGNNKSPEQDDIYQRGIEIDKKLKEIEIEKTNNQLLEELEKIEEQVEALQSGDNEGISAIAQRLAEIAQRIKGTTKEAEQLKDKIYAMEQQVEAIDADLQV